MGSLFIITLSVLAILGPLWLIKICFAWCLNFEPRSFRRPSRVPQAKATSNAVAGASLVQATKPAA